MNRTLGFVFVLLAGVGFGFIGVFSRLAFQSGIALGPLLILRFAMAAAILWVSLLIWKPRLLRPELRQIFISLGLGIFGYAVFSTLYFKAIQGLSVPLAALLLFSFPIYVNLGSYIFFKEHLSRQRVLSLALSIIGLIILLWGPLRIQSNTAVLYGLMSGLTYGAYVLISGRVQQKIHPLSSSLYVISGAALALAFYHHPNFDEVRLYTMNQWSVIAGLALICTIAPLTFFLAGLQRIPSGQASILVMIEPVIAAIAAGVFLNEQLSSLQSIGALVILTALILNALEQK
jgi:drug/metabolite transporter (DMT)-like permease